MLSATTTLLSNAADAPKDRTTPYQLDVTRLPDQVLYVYQPCDFGQFVHLVGDDPGPRDATCHDPVVEVVSEDIPIPSQG